MVEIWKDVVGYEGLYEVSNFGRVRSRVNNHEVLRTEPKMLKLVKNNNGYIRISLCKEGKKVSKAVHRMVAEAFLENPSNLPQVNHKDEDRTNNFIFFDENGTVVPEKSNLEWCDAKHNINWGTRTEKNAMARLNHPKMSKKVYQFDLEGNLVKTWPSTYEVERQTGWAEQNISACCLGKYKTAHGFVWRYSESVPPRTVQTTLF